MFLERKSLLTIIHSCYFLYFKLLYVGPILYIEYALLYALCNKQNSSCNTTLLFWNTIEIIYRIYFLFVKIFRILQLINRTRAIGVTLITVFLRRLTMRSVGMKFSPNTTISICVHMASKNINRIQVRPSTQKMDILHTFDSLPFFYIVYCVLCTVIILSRKI